MTTTSPSLSHSVALVVLCITATLTSLVNLLGLSLTLIFAGHDALGPSGSLSDKVAFFAFLLLIVAPILCWVALWYNHRRITVALALIPITVFLITIVSSTL